MSVIDAISFFMQADALVARDHSQEASETHLASDHLLSAMTGHSPDSSGDTQSEQDDAQPAQQSLSTAVASQPTGATHAHFNGHAQHQSRSQLRHPEGSASQGEEEEEEEDDEEDTMQVKYAHVYPWHAFKTPQTGSYNALHYLIHTQTTPAWVG